MIMFSKLTIAFAVVVGLTSGAFAAPKGHVTANSWHAYVGTAPVYNAWNAYASAGPVYNAGNAYASAGPVSRSPESFGRSWDPYGMRWE